MKSPNQVLTFAEEAMRWTKASWRSRYSYTFTWLGRPIIQLPDDMIRLQEVIFQLKPDVIVETGIAHGGSLIFSASLCKLLGAGRIIGVDVEIRPHNRTAIEGHFLSPLITLIEGSSTAPVTVEKVKSLIVPGEKVLVILDSCHTFSHVLRELRLYSELVTVDSFIVATDGVMKDLADEPGGQPHWVEDNPCSAAEAFVAENRRFEIERPLPTFDDSRIDSLDDAPTYWPKAWLKRKK